MAKAVRFYETGGPEVLKFENVEVGDPGPGQARVRHTYIAVNFIDIYFRTGHYPLELPNGLGSDAVGVVEAVGPGVTDIRVGDRVGYLLGPQGAYSDVRVMPADVLIPLPDGIADRTAATLMMKGMTAQYLFRQVYPLKGGETILYHAAAGGVGLIACQWARALGVTMIGTVSSDEKAEIAKRHLIKKQIDNHGLNENEFLLKDKGLYEIIRHYTREAGVRNLEREISKLCRKVLTHIIKDKKKSVKVDEKNISDLLGVKKFKYGLAEESNQIGVATGLAWTEVGGDLLSIEAIKLPGKGRMKSTGKLGEVMKESIDAASSFVRSRSPSFGIIPTLFDKYDIHVHVPEGATPKDGPSAGIAMFTAIVSAFTGVPIKNNIAMTGEITLRGRVLPIGGLKEKLLAAVRGGIKEVLIPIENKKDLSEIDEKEILDNIEIHFVENANEIVKKAFISKIYPYKENSKKNLDIPSKTITGEKSPLPH